MNTSDAIGTISLKGNWLSEDIVTLSYALCMQSYYEYSILFNTQDTDIKNLFEFVHNALTIHGVIYFEGIGRWCFENNLMDFHSRIKPNKQFFDEFIKCVPDEYKITLSEYEYKLILLLRCMHNKQLQLMWDYKDIEPNQDILYACTGVHSVSYDKLNYGNTRFRSYPCNLKYYCGVYEGGNNKALECVVDQILFLYKLEDKCKEYITNHILKHPTWFDLMPFHVVDTKRELPYRLRKWINLIVKGVLQC